MPVVEWQSAPTINDLTGYRAWGQGIHDAFIAMGLVQTADTGQVNWSTAALGAATVNTAWGYEVYRFNDAAQATTPIFLKVEYGRGGSTTTDVPTIWLTVGRASNGTGTITGNLWLTRQVLVGSNSATAYGGASPYPCFATGDSSGFAMALHTTFNPTVNDSPAASLLIERSRDSAGVATSEGLVVSATGAGSAASHAVNILGAAAILNTFQHTQPMYLGYLPGTVNNVTAIAGSFSNILGTSKDSGVAVNVFPLSLATPGVTPWNSKLIMMSHPGDVQYAPLVAMSRYGAAHTYRLFPHIYGVSVPATPIALASKTGAVVGHVLPALLWDA